MIQIYLVIALVFAVVTGGGALYIKTLRAEKATLTQAYGIAAQTAIDNKAQLDRQVAERGRVDAILLDHVRAQRKLEVDNALLNRAIDALKRTDPQVRAWADVPVPDSLRSLLNGPAPAAESGSDQTVPAGVPDRTDPPPGDRHPH